jgi:hypothetical protein
VNQHVVGKLKMGPVSHRSTSVGDVVVVDSAAFQCSRGIWVRMEEFKSEPSLPESACEMTRLRAKCLAKEERRHAVCSSSCCSRDITRRLR